MKYYGIDTSIAPLPRKGNSVAQLIEILGVNGFGSNGTLYITSFLTDLLKLFIEKSNIISNGFNGIMFSCLEDPGMSQINNAGRFTVDSLLAYSAVCGCGIDMVPIPGDTFEEEISSIILDVAGLSCAWDKPLGIRLLPIPMKKENEFTDFNHDFLYNTRVFGLGRKGMEYDFFNNQYVKINR
jgi:uncharacterized protein (UPF0210 family)